MQRSLILVLLLFSTLVQSAPSEHELNIANAIADQGWITDYSHNPVGYRLTDTITRAEALGIALQMANISLPEKYFCRDYFQDVRYNNRNNWVCRAVEVAADNYIISRNNRKANPSSPVTRVEALAIILKAAGINYPKNIDRTGYSATTPQWQIDTIQAALSNNIIMSVSNLNPNAYATRMYFIGMIYNLKFASKQSSEISIPLRAAPDEKTQNSISAVEGNEEANNNEEESGKLSDFLISAPEKVIVNEPFQIKVATLNDKGMPIENYRGTIFFDTNDNPADIVFPGEQEYTFTSADKGQHIFVNGFTIKKPGDYELVVFELDGPNGGIEKVIKVTVTDEKLRSNIPQSDQVSKFQVGPCQIVHINQPFEIPVEAVNENYVEIKTYTGTVSIDEYDAQGKKLAPSAKILPQTYTFTEADKGKHIFKNVALKSIGTYTIIFTDSKNNRAAGTCNSAAIAANTIIPASFSVKAPKEVKLLTPFYIEISALDKYQNILKDYTGTVYFGFNNSNQLAGPSSYTFTEADQGTHNFSDEFFITEPGNYEFIIIDHDDLGEPKKTINIVASENGPANVSRPLYSSKLARLDVTFPQTVKVNTPFDLTLSAYDRSGNILTDYEGDVLFTVGGSSADTDYVIPRLGGEAGYRFAPSDEGTHTFSKGFTFKKAGTYALTFQDGATRSSQYSIAHIYKSITITVSD